MSITISRTTIPEMTVVTLRGTVPTYSDEGQLWAQMMPLLAAQGITPIGPCGVIEHDDQYTEHDVDLSIFLPVAPGTRAEAPLEILELPERDCLVARVLGSFAQILLLSFGLAVAVGSLIRSGLGAVIVGLVVASSAVVVLGVWWYLALVPEDRARLPLTIDNVYGSVYLDTMTPGSLVRRMGYAGAGGAEMSFVDACRESGRAAQPAADVRCLAQHGVTDRLIVYVDGSRYAQLVATLGGACATVAGLGIGFGLWRLRRQVL